MTHEIPDQSACSTGCRISANTRGFSPLAKLANDKPGIFQVFPDKYERQRVARQVVRRGSRNHNVGYFASRLNRALVPFESTLEKQACILLETHPTVVSYRTQPYAIQLCIGDRQTKVFPDLEIITNNGAALADVKFEHASRKYGFRKRAAALHQYAEQRGMRYSVLTEIDIRVTRMSHGAWLTGLARGNFSPELIEAVWSWLGSCDNSSIAFVFDRVSGFPAIQGVLASLILDGHLAIDWDQSILDQPLSLVFGSGE